MATQTMTLPTDGTITLSQETTDAIGLYPGQRYRVVIDGQHILIAPFLEQVSTQRLSDLDDLADLYPELKGAAEELISERNEHTFK